MPHRSRLAILLLDLPPEHHVAGSDFWVGATGRSAEPDHTDADWSSLGSFADGQGVAVEALQRRDLEAFVRGLMSSGLSPRSVARTVAGVRGFYRFVALEQKWDGSPAEDLRAPRAWTALPKFLDLAEVDKLLAVPDTTTPRGLRDKAMIEVLYATGMRVS